MKLLVGYTADERGAEAIELASALVAGTPEASLQIAIVLPAAAPFNAVYPGGDHGYSSILSAQVDQWAEQALELVPEGRTHRCLLRPVGELDLEAEVESFRSEVLDQTLRERIRAETEPIRTMILAQAFSRTGVVDPKDLG